MQIAEESPLGISGKVYAVYPLGELSSRWNRTQDVAFSPVMDSCYCSIEFFRLQPEYNHYIVLT